MSDRRSRLKRSRISSEEFDSSSSSSSTTSSSDEETGAKSLKPIKEYLYDRKELASQLFKSVKIEKIRMMLPQILKKVDINDLEELCANELIGMSKARILSIINGKEMVDSSNTEDSDDQDSSLEIISDTDLLSGDEKNVKAESANSNKKDSKKPNKKSQDQKKEDVQIKSKGKGKSNSKVKNESKEKEKQKEGETLLDLLELEMRARAIRALIRKEEDTTNPKDTQSSNSVSTVSKSRDSYDKNKKARKDNLKEQLEKIDVLMKQGEDEDVFVVVQSAPTIELLSSESDTEDNSKRVNQKLVNERTSESEKIQGDEKCSKSKDKNTNKENDKIDEKLNANVNKDKNEEKNKIENKEKENPYHNSNLLIGGIENNRNNKPEDSNKLLKNIDLEDGEIVDDNDNDNVTEANNETEVTNQILANRKIKKIKRNPYIRSRKKHKEKNLEFNKVESSDKDDSKPQNEKNIKKNEQADAMEFIEIVESPQTKNNGEEMCRSKKSDSDINSKMEIYDDKLDIDEVINLDDYPDDMYDLEKSEVNEEKNNTDKIVNLSSKDPDQSNNTETWATRYYKQDDVQNVIKESKIQSEIRKRLRERQRQSKMNNTPKANQEVFQQNPEAIIPKPTGSVKEYLALKGLSCETMNSTSNMGESSKLLKTDDSIGQSNVFINNDKNVEQSIIFFKKPKLVSDVNKNSDSTVTEDVASTQLDNAVKCNNSPLNNSESCFEQKISFSSDKTKGDLYWNNQNSLENFQRNLSKKLEQNESNNLRNITCSLTNNETSLNSNSNNDKTFVEKENIILSDKTLVQEISNQTVSKQINPSILSESKTSELRPD